MNSNEFNSNSYPVCSITILDCLIHLNEFKSALQYVHYNMMNALYITQQPHSDMHLSNLISTFGKLMCFNLEWAAENNLIRTTAEFFFCSLSTGGFTWLCVKRPLSSVSKTTKSNPRLIRREIQQTASTQTFPPVYDFLKTEHICIDFRCNVPSQHIHCQTLKS